MADKDRVTHPVRKAPPKKQRYVAFLRAINVGGRFVKMDDLLSVFDKLGLTETETFIASGNIVFKSSVTKSEALRERISAGLEKALGYEVETFLRTDNDLTRIAAYQAFPGEALKGAEALNIAFVHAHLDQEAKRKLMALRTDIDDFAVDGREIYWLCRRKQSESTISNAVIEKTLRMKTTIRSISTIKKIAAKYPPPAPPGKWKTGR